MLCWGGLYVYVVGGIIVFLVINFVEKSLLEFVLLLIVNVFVKIFFKLSVFYL